MSRIVLFIGEPAFNLPPASYQFQSSNEIRAKILEVAESHGITLVVSPELADGTRQLEKAMGTAVSYFQGGDPALNGFSPKAYTSLIFIRADRIKITAAHI